MPVTIGGSGPITGVTSINTTVSDTELGYLDGVTSALQTQINGKAAKVGSVLQVVSTTKTDTFSMSSATYAEITGLTASITPTSSSSSVLVIVNLGVVDSSAWTQQYVRVMRGSTAIGVGAAAGSRIQASTHSRYSGGGSTAYGPVSFAVLDSPATTSATTYSVQIGTVQTATIYVNRNSSDTDSASNARTASTITLLEVGA